MAIRLAVFLTFFFRQMHLKVEFNVFTDENVFLRLCVTELVESDL